jgi:hypothetical protein
VATVLCGLGLPSPLYGADRGAGTDEGLEMAADALVVRPLSLVATVVGGVVWVVSAPFHALGGNTAEATRVLLEEPAAYTFQRPLGDFSHCERYGPDGCVEP